MLLGKFYWGSRGKLRTLYYYLVSDFRGILFDILNGVDTRGQILVGTLNLPSDLQPHAVRYRATRIRTFLTSIRALPIRDYSEYSFIDFGSGKGRCLLLATQFGFRSITGIELSPLLCEQASKNIRAWSKRHPHGNNGIMVQCCDAAKATLPEGKTVYFFYNPFDAEIMQKVIGRIPSIYESFVVYINPQYESVITAAGYNRIGGGKKVSQLYSIFHRPQSNP
jgi:SAM-dependent methyltransferase